MHVDTDFAAEFMRKEAGEGNDGQRRVGGSRLSLVRTWHSAAALTFDGMDVPRAGP
jgi:hypothetical protein